MNGKKCWSRGWIMALVLVFGVSAMAAPSGAEKLIGKVAGDPLMVVATSGLGEIQPTFDKTFLGKVAADQNVQKFAQDILAQGLKLVGNEMPDPELVNMIKGYVCDVAQCPILLGVSQLATPNGPIPVHAYLYIDASKNKEKVLALLNLFNEQVVGDNLAQKEVQGVELYGPSDDNGVPGYWGFVGDVLVLGVNDGEGLAVQALKSGASKKIEALSKIPSQGDAFVEFLNYGKMLDLVTAMVPQSEAQVKQIVTVLFEKAGLRNIDTVAIRAGFKEANMVMDSYVGLKGPRTGLQAQMKPVSSDLLAMVPAQAMTASVSHFDLPAAFDMAVQAADQIMGGQATAMVDMGVGMIQGQFGVDVREAIIKNLAGPSICYSVPQGVMPEAMNGGPVGIITLKDSDAFAQVLLTVEKIAQPLAKGQFQPGTQEVDGRTMHTWAVGPLAMMQMVPTWTMVDNRLIFSTDTTLCAAAAKQVASKDKATSLLSSDSYKKAASSLPSSTLGVGYVDTKKQIKQMMNGLQRIWPMGAMMASSQGIQLPFALPSLDHLMTDLKPVCNYSVEKDGAIYGHYEGTGIEMAIGAAVGAGVGVAMPAIMEKQHGSHDHGSASGMTEMTVPTN